MITDEDPTFLNCRCPDCKQPFDYVPLDADDCPFCNAPINPDAVWKTRKYPGHLLLPGWLKAFGWPFLLMLSGPAFFAYAYYGYNELELKIPAALFSIGLIFFVFKLHHHD